MRSWRLLVAASVASFGMSFRVAWQFRFCMMETRIAEAHVSGGYLRPMTMRSARRSKSSRHHSIALESRMTRLVSQNSYAISRTVGRGRPARKLSESNTTRWRVVLAEEGVIIDAHTSAQPSKCYTFVRFSKFRSATAEGLA